jgi:hypothetical protein
VHRFNNSVNRAGFYTQRYKGYGLSESRSYIEALGWIHPVPHWMLSPPPTQWNMNRSGQDGGYIHIRSSVECTFFETVSSNDMFHVPILMTGFPHNTTFNLLYSNCTVLLFGYMFRHTATSSD